MYKDDTTRSWDPLPFQSVLQLISNFCNPSICTLFLPCFGFDDHLFDIGTHLGVPVVGKTGGHCFWSTPLGSMVRYQSPHLGCHHLRDETFNRIPAFQKGTDFCCWARSTLVRSFWVPVRKVS